MNPELLSLYLTGNPDGSVFGNVSFLDENDEKQIVEVSPEKIEQIKAILFS